MKKLISAAVTMVLLMTPAGFCAIDDAKSALSVEQRLELLEAKLVQSQQQIKLLEEKVAQSGQQTLKVEAIEKENGSLRTKVATLEAQLTKAPTGLEIKTVEPAKKTILDTVKLKGRFAAGFFKQANGNGDYSTQPPFSHGSFEVPETKLFLIVNADDNNTVLMRANLNNATWNSLDVFCIDSKIGTLIPGYADMPFTVESRLGRFKMPYGEEMFSNDMVNSATTDNSAVNAAGYDEGVQFIGNLGKEKPLKYWASITNGPGTGSSTGTTRDNYFPKAFTGRLGYQLLDPLYASASVYTSGGLGTQACDMSFGTLTAMPSGATGWKRSMWETDLRYDIGKGKNVTGDLQGGYCDSTAYLRGALGQVYDTVDGAGALDRDSNYGIVEALWNFHPKVYGALRYSLIDVMHDNSATLNYLNYAKYYERYSFGVGYRWSDKTILRVAYEINSADLDSTRTTFSDSNDDMLMVTLGMIF